VVDRNGDTHSVKSGKRKWQIFLYSRSRFLQDRQFRVMNGIGDILLQCIDAFPEDYGDYLSDKQRYKERLRPHMRELRQKLSDKQRCAAFVDKSMFNAGEVEYLTVLDDQCYHVFHREDVVSAVADNVAVENSKKRARNQTADQKAVFKWGTIIGEIEMRRDNSHRRREIKFWLNKPRTMHLLRASILQHETLVPNTLIVYGQAVSKFAPKHRE
jgi:hypothetical protein